MCQIHNSIVLNLEELYLQRFSRLFCNVFIGLTIIINEDVRSFTLAISYVWIEIHRTLDIIEQKVNMLNQTSIFYQSVFLVKTVLTKCLGNLMPFVKLM